MFYQYLLILPRSKTFIKSTNSAELTFNEMHYFYFLDNTESYTATGFLINIEWDINRNHDLK